MTASAKAPAAETTIEARLVADQRRAVAVRNRNVLIGRIVLGVGLIALWALAAHLLGPLLLPRPDEVVVRLIETIVSGVLPRHALSTLSLAASGFIAAAVAGVVIPLALAFVPRTGEAIAPYVRGAMGLPPFALAPLLVLWLGIGSAPKLVIVFAVVFFLMFTATDAGVRNIDGKLVTMSRVLGASRSTLAREVLLPSTLPFIIVGAKVAIPRAIGAAIVGEFIVSDQGIGHYIEHSRQMSDNVGVFAGVVAVTALILAINAVLKRIEHMLLGWRPKAAVGM